MLEMTVAGKSQLMQYAAKLSPRGVVSSGRGSSSAGLTVTAIKDGGQWALEAGALVLADGGLLFLHSAQLQCKTNVLSLHAAAQTLRSCHVQEVSAVLMSLTVSKR